MQVVVIVKERSSNKRLILHVAYSLCTHNLIWEIVHRCALVERRRIFLVDEETTS